MKGITRRNFIKYSSIAALASAFIGERVSSATSPNILLITGDDLGQYLGCYGDTIARTPNLDRLASQGMRFVNSYVTNASCSSSRSSLFTGLYPHQTGFFPPDNKPVGQIGLAFTSSGYQMDAGVVTMPQLLKIAGYRTGIIGKLHVFPETSFPFDYKQTGVNTRDIELVAQRAGEFLAKPQRPFFLKVSYSDPHYPFSTQINGYPQQPFSATRIPPFPWQGIDTPTVRERMAGYYNGVARLDAGIEMLLNKLVQLDLTDNTMVIFIGDHGPGFTRAKVSCYEAGLRVPLMVRWPGRITPNTVNKSLVSTVDIMPTVLRAAGITVLQNLPGRSLIQLFQGNITGWRGVLAAEYTSHTRDNFYPRRCIRGARYKYILNLLPERDNPVAFIDGDTVIKEARNLPVNHPARIAMNTCFNPPAEELYDLAVDPIEFKNLAAIPEYLERKKFLQRQLLEWRQQTADPLLNPAVLAAMELEHYGT